MVSAVLLADGAVGAACIDWLIDHYRQDIGLIGVTADNEILRLAEAADLPTEIFVSSQQMADAINQRGLRPDIGLLLWWPTILCEPLLSLPRRGFVNTHPSLLPYNRGKHYSFWAIVEASPFGVTLHFTDQGIDSGDVIVQAPIPVDWTDTGESLFFKAKEAMIRLVQETYPVLRGENIPRRPQPPDVGSFHKSGEIVRASAIDLDRTYTARELLNLMRAKTFAGLPGCWFEDEGRKFEIAIKIKEKP